MDAETLFKAWLEVITKMVNFDKMTKKQKEETVLAAAVNFKGNDYSWHNKWFWEKYGKGGYYEGDVFGLLGIGASGGTEIFILKYILKVPDENIFCNDYLQHYYIFRKLLRNRAVFYNCNSITSAFNEGVKPLLKRHKIDPFGRPKNWAKLIKALHETGEYDAEQMLKFSFIFWKFENEKAQPPTVE